MALSQDLELLRMGRPDLAALPAEAFDALFGRAARRTAPENRHFDGEGRCCTSLDILLGGAKRVYKVDEKGKTVNMFTLSRFQICPLNILCILADEPFPAQAQSLAPLDYLSVPAEDVKAAFAAWPEVRTCLLKGVYADMNSLVLLLSELVCRGVRDRLQDLLLRMAVDGEVASTHQNLATELSTAREVVSKVLKQMEDEGLVELARMRITLRPGLLDQ